MLAAQLLPLLLVAIIAALAVLHPEFNDNLLQRIGLSCICFGACVSMALLLQDQTDRSQSYSILVDGLAIYAVGTFVKFRKMHRPVTGPT